MRHNSFVSFHLKIFNRRNPSKCKLSDFQLFAWKLTNFLMWFFKPRVTFHCHGTKFLWNFLAELLCFGKNEIIKVQTLRLLCTLMKVHSIRHASFETTSSTVIQILHRCSVSWKITSLYLLAQTFILCPKSNFQTFGWLGKHSPNSLCHAWNYESGFFKTLYHSSVSREITFLYFFSWNCTWFEQKEPIEVQNFRLSTAHVKFHQVCTLIGSFCCKYIKFQLKMYRGVMSYDHGEWCKIWRKTDLLFPKWQEFDPSTQKSQKFALWLVPIAQSI